MREGCQTIDGRLWLTMADVLPAFA